MKHTAPHNIKYRKDIDGLRAVAVLSVIFFHINPSWIPGGFLGVDIFFVISGYLITLILIKELKNTGRISFLNFYKRRINRIVPASLLVLLVTTVAGFLILTPSDLLDLAHSAIWSFFSAANIYFYLAMDTGYFANATHEIPLLHFWSLGVEEQFYFIWPITMLSMGYFLKSVNNKLLFILFLTIASLVFANYYLKIDRSFTYYMIPTRAWELLAGGLLALLAFYQRIKFTLVTYEVTSIVGLLLVFVSFFLVKKTSAVPGLASMPVIIGCCLLIGSNIQHQTLVSRILSLKIFVAIGLLSYSAYLWHWPVLAFLKYSLIQVDLLVGACVLLGTFLLAAASYYWVETPFRKNTGTVKEVIFYRLALPAFIVCGVYLALVQSIEMKSFIYPWTELELATTNTQAAYKYNYNCQYSIFEPEAFTETRCVYPENASSPDALLIGDSNAAHYVGLLREIADKYDFSFRNATQSSCPMIFGANFNWISKRYAKGCATYRSSVLQEAKKYDTVFIGGNWSRFHELAGFKKAFRATISEFSSSVKNVILMGKVPIFRNYNRNCEERSVQLKFLNCSTYFKRKLRDHRANEFLRKIAAKYPNVEYFGIRTQLCDGAICSPYLNGQPLYFDAGHLSMEGSHLIGKTLIKNEDPSLMIINLKDETRPSQRPQISIDESRDFIKFVVHPVKKNVQIAFYLYRGNKRIDTQPYSKNFDYRMDKNKYNNGKFRVRYFIVNEATRNPGKSKNKETGYSDYVEIDSGK